MKINFRDMYGQHVEVHDETASGNVRMKVNTMKDLNGVRAHNPEECDTKTDISLTKAQVSLLINFLQNTQEEQ